MKLLKGIIFAVLMLNIAPVISKERFAIPDSYKTKESPLPVSYLEDLQIFDTSVKLKNSEDVLLSCLLNDAAIKSEELYEQSYLIKVRSPVIMLFIFNHADFKKERWQGKKSNNEGVVLLSTLAKFIKANSLCNETT
jgi:hypothetical protein